MAGILRLHVAARVMGGAVLGAMLGLAGAAGPAAAGFVCKDNVTNGGGGSIVSAGNSVACGLNANAGGANSENLALGSGGVSAAGNASANIAIGFTAHASNNNAAGASSANLALGKAASADGNTSTNIAIGNFGHRARLQERQYRHRQRVDRAHRQFHEHRQ